MHKFEEFKNLIICTRYFIVSRWNMHFFCLICSDVKTEQSGKKGRERV